MQLNLAEINELGANLIALSPQLPEQALATVEENKLEFQVLSDVGNHVARKFGLLFRLPEQLQPVYKQFGIDLQLANGDDSQELPVPATFIVDTNGLIILDFVDVNHTKRVEPSVIIEKLKKIVTIQVHAGNLQSPGM